MADQAMLLMGLRWMLLLCALGSWVGYFYFARRMVRGRQGGVAIFDRRFVYNPFNICFRPSLLTESGLRARRWFFACCAGLPLSILGLVSIGR